MRLAFFLIPGITPLPPTMLKVSVSRVLAKTPFSLMGRLPFEAPYPGLGGLTVFARDGVFPPPEPSRCLRMLSLECQYVCTPLKVLALSYPQPIFELYVGTVLV